MRNNRFINYFFSLHLIFDLVCLVFCFFWFLKLQYLTYNKHDDLITLFIAHYKALIIFILSWYFIAQNQNFYEKNSFRTYVDRLKKIIVQFTLYSIIVFALSGFKKNDLYSNRISLYYIATFATLVLIERTLFFFISKLILKNIKIKENAVFIDKNKSYNTLKQIISSSKYYNINPLKEVINSPEEFIEITQNHNINYAFISLNNGISIEEQEKYIDLAENKHIKLFFIPDSSNDPNTSLILEYFDTFPVFTFKTLPLDTIWNQILKRGLDIVFSIGVLLFLIPFVFPFICLAIIIDSGFPILYKQKRNGLYGKEFLCLKFRTMRPSKDNDIKATVRGDSRITKIGQFLRKTSLDELPQFFNVLKGEMSIVGPRPHMITQDEHYSNIIKKYSLRHYVKPGITGLAQISGFRGEINSDRDMELRIRSDIYYVRNWYFALDVIIIIKTFLKVLKGDQNAI